jgi:hypothetical protein
MLGRFLGKKAQAEVYLSLNDLHSFMLVQMLSRLAKNYQIDLMKNLSLDIEAANAYQQKHDWQQ